MLLSSEPPDRSRLAVSGIDLAVFSGCFQGPVMRRTGTSTVCRGEKGLRVRECTRGDMALYGMGSEYYSKDMCRIMNMMLPQYTELCE